MLKKKLKKYINFTLPKIIDTININNTYLF